MESAGERLYKIVEDYAALGDHRTGTPVDRATIEWFGNEIRVRGARVEQLPYTFDRFVAECRLTAGDSEIDALPLYYEAIGRVDSLSIYVAELDVSIPGSSTLGGLINRASRSGADAAVFATTGQGERLVAINRAATIASGFPVVLAPSSTLSVLKQGDVHLDMDARIEASGSATVVGYLGEGDHSRPVIVGTPISGWFRCAGERATGIAVAIELAVKLAERWPVMMVGTTGHELHHLGLQHFLESQELQPLAAIHIGASVAGGVSGPDGSLALAPTRRTLTNASEETVQLLKAILAPAAFKVEANPSVWGGESYNWIALGAPMLSFLGQFPLFHTSGDLPHLATSASLLETASDCVSKAAHLFVENSLN